MNINERVKLIRNSLNLTQKEFGQKLTLAQTYLSQIEKGDRDVTEKILKIICFEFSVKEEWLRYGTGDIFIKKDNSILFSFQSEYNLDDFDIKLIKSYISLSKVEKSIIQNLVKNINL